MPPIVPPEPPSPVSAPGSLPDRRSYVTAALSAFVRLPDTPNRPCRDDRFFAASLHRDRVPLRLLFAAFLLATARRTIPRRILPDAPAHQPIRLLRFFAPVVAELQNDSSLTDPSYMTYLSIHCARAGRRLPSFDEHFHMHLTRTPPSRQTAQLSLPFD